MLLHFILADRKFHLRIDADSQVMMLLRPKSAWFLPAYSLSFIGFSAGCEFLISDVLSFALFPLLLCINVVISPLLPNGFHSGGIRCGDRVTWFTPNVRLRHLARVRILWCFQGSLGSDANSTYSAYAKVTAIGHFCCIPINSTVFMLMHLHDVCKLPSSSNCFAEFSC